MKITTVHNVYKPNPYIKESVRINLAVLREAKVDYKWIIFNDKGDKIIYDDIKEFLSDPRISYIYSDVNYGLQRSGGGWIGAQPLITGDLVQIIGQDDVYTPAFYKRCIAEFEKDPDLMMTHTNAFKVDENLQLKEIMLDPNVSPDYSKPFEIFKAWFGVGQNGKDEVTRANNYILAPTVIYRQVLHEKIGIPDIESFLGSSDFEYYARILFYGHKAKFINEALVLYRRSKGSIGDAPDIQERCDQWNAKIRDKYRVLYEQKKASKQ